MQPTKRLSALVLLAFLVLVRPWNCAPPEAPDVTDAGPAPQGDAGTSPDAGSRDGGTPADSGWEMDAGSHRDAGVQPDAGGCPAGQSKGPEGNCRDACITCESSSDCRSGELCVLAENTGCTSCQSATAGMCQQSESCTQQSDCCGEMFCLSPNGPGLCGICIMNPHECGPTMPCDGGQVCSPVPPSTCSSCDPQPGTECVPPCTQTGCGTGTQCDETTQLCTPVQCNAGYSCPPYEVCDPGSGDSHGCAFVSCTSDAQCAEGVCVEGSCEPQPGYCTYPAG